VLDSTLGQNNSFGAVIRNPLEVCPVNPNQAFGGGTSSMATADLPRLGASLLLPFRGDSAVWFDADKGVLIVIDAKGDLVRAIRPPSISVPPVSSPVQGLVYTLGLRSLPMATPGGAAPRTPDDTVPVVRVQFGEVRQDTLTWLATGRTGPPIWDNLVQRSVASTLYPFADRAVATSDGWIGVFRAREYRFDWLSPSGERDAGRSLAFPWRPITPAAREAIADSINASRTRIYDSLMAKRAADSVRTGSPPMVSGCYFSNGRMGISQTPETPPRLPNTVSPDDIPAYYPPTLTTSPVLADAEGRVWIRTTAPSGSPGMDVWDVIARSGGVVDRVRISQSVQVLGFGPGVVYLAVRDGGEARIQSRSIH
jgi:hypothetical protein